jgi:hypothetical protein
VVSVGSGARRAVGGVLEPLAEADPPGPGQDDPQAKGLDPVTFSVAEPADVVAERRGDVRGRSGAETNEHVREGVPRGAC